MTTLVAVLALVLLVGNAPPVPARTALPPPPAGYWVVAADGGVFAFGSAPFRGSAGNLHLNQPVVGMARTTTGRGYWLVAADGGVFTFGDAGFFGSAVGMPLRAPVVGIARTPSGHGYWLVAADGGVLTFGDAQFLGSFAGPNANVSGTAGAAAHPKEQGYWLLDILGGVEPFGAAMGSHPSCIDSRRCATAIAATSTGGGFAIVTPSGSVNAVGDAPRCSLGTRPSTSMIGITLTHDDRGCWLLGRDGGVFALQDAPFLGSLAGVPLNAPPVGIAAA